MNETIKAKWIKALESGKYKQGTQVLCNANDNTYCCLGVLCDLAAKAGVVTQMGVRYTPSCLEDPINAVAYGSVHPKYTDICQDNVTFLPPQVMKWAEITCPDPKVEIKQSLIGEKTIRALSLLNDEGSSFAEIAKLIKEQM
jgi:hypothetical protein